MKDKVVTPSISSNSFNCPHCGALAHQTWFRAYGRQISNGKPHWPTKEQLEFLAAKVRLAQDSGDEDQTSVDVLEYARRIFRGEVFFHDTLSDHAKPPHVANLHVSQCYSCTKLAVWAADRLIFPSLQTFSVQPNPDFSDDIRCDFLEAASIFDGSPRGAAALLRLAIQKLCTQLGEPGKNINDDIASLVRKGLDVRVQRALDIVRVIGNETVHPGVIDLRDDRDTALELFRLVNLIADVMISQPKHIEAMYADLPESKRKAIEERDKR
jgi:hypothetical protein